MNDCVNIKELINEKLKKIEKSKRSKCIDKMIWTNYRLIIFIRCDGKSPYY